MENDVGDFEKQYVLRNMPRRMSNEEDASQYRAVVARLNYLAADRPDIAFAVKEFARSMSAPTQGSRDRLKRLGRY